MTRLTVDTLTFELDQRTDDRVWLTVIAGRMGVTGFVTLEELDQLARWCEAEAQVWRRRRHAVMPDWYSVLGVARDASPDEIQQAYRTLAKRYHPDASNGDTGAAMQHINEANAVLGDPQRRHTYDTLTHNKGESAC